GLLTTGLLIGWLLYQFGALDPAGGAGRVFATWGSLPFAAALAVQLLFALAHRRRGGGVLRAVERRSRDLALPALVLERVAGAAFTSPRLRQLRAALEAPAGAARGAEALPSHRVARLGNLVDLLESRRNQLFAPLAYLLLWGTQVAYAIERWRAASGG